MIRLDSHLLGHGQEKVAEMCLGIHRAVIQANAIAIAFEVLHEAIVVNMTAMLHAK